MIKKTVKQSFEKFPADAKAFFLSDIYLLVKRIEFAWLFCRLQSFARIYEYSARFSNTVGMLSKGFATGHSKNPRSIVNRIFRM